MLSRAANYYDGHMMNTGDWGWGLLMMLFWAVVFVVVVVLIIRAFSDKPEAAQKGRNPLDIAKERYAKGEIKKQEFEQIKKDLK